MGSVLTKLLDYGGFRGCGCVIELPLEEEKEEEQFGLMMHSFCAMHREIKICSHFLGIPLF